MAKKQQQLRERPEEHAVQPHPIIRANANRAVTPSPNFFSVYANDAQLQSTPWDVRLIFGVIAGFPTEETQTVEITQLGEIRLSPQLAKKLTMVLIQQLKAYEERFGQIPLPPD
jgi:hypothetical protein